MMNQFWSYTLTDGRRVIVEEFASEHFDLFLGFGVIRTIIAA